MCCTMNDFSVAGQIVDVNGREIFPGEILVSGGRIVSIRRVDSAPLRYIMPGFVDSHVHIESSMLTPSRFAQLVVPRGTIAVVSDPHEIANVAGVEGVEYMIRDAKKVPLKVFFGAPSCVPATSFETSGAVLGPEEVRGLLEREDVWFLSEMMNFPGVVGDVPDVIKKIEYAQLKNKPVDGHAPGLRGEALKKYVSYGISTDHECSSYEEAEEKIKLGVKIQVREGSAARNFDALHNLFSLYPDSLMLCTDDSHPDEIISDGHIDRLIRLGLKKYNVDLFDLLRSASVVPVEHYKIPVGLLREGDYADFLVVSNLEEFDVLESYIDGRKVYDKRDGVLFSFDISERINRFRTNMISASDLKIVLPEECATVRVIDVKDGELLTGQYLWKPSVSPGQTVESSVAEDVLKLVVVNRYSDQKPSIGFVRNVGLKKGAIASTVAHDSHNIIATGTDDTSIAKAVNAIIECGGGIAVYDGESVQILALPVGGLMSDEDGSAVAAKYQLLNDTCKELGSHLKAPFMCLAFLSLLVIPSLKLGDRGLFDVDKFNFVPLFE
jgi:adenine deaminase